MNEISQITVFAGVKFLARKFDCVKSWTNIMSAVIVVHLIKIYTNHAPVESEAIPGKQSTGCQQNEGAETEDKNV